MSHLLFHTGTKADTLSFIRDNGLPAPDVNVLTDVELDDKVTDWYVAGLECLVCGNRHNAIIPAEAIEEDVPLECANCGQYACVIVEGE